ncbi:MAG: hypothetical protein H6765_10560 [Candidatus Peribacteria bacterium]|nr:MAG: hypothetical protein H6765_10560 [Candidatus Peribacteria bacterium]
MYATSKDPDNVAGAPWTCVHGYELDIEKTILTRAQYETGYSPEYNTYQDYIFEDGEVQTGDWYIYRIKVTNTAEAEQPEDPDSNGAPGDHGHAYNIHVFDTMPAGVSIFWIEEQEKQEQFGGPVDVEVDFPGDATSFDWIIPQLGPGESDYIDIFVELAVDAPYASGDTYCNT